MKRPAASALRRPAAKQRDLGLEDFEALGDFARAGLEATRLALDRAAESLADGRIPIAGAAVRLTEGGRLEVLVVGHNGRIPPPGTDEEGYPTDHGETAAIRQLPDAGAVDWGRVVFATSLSPCVMCGAAMTWLWNLGLRRVVVAESTSFSGTAPQLAALDGMTVVSLSSARAQSLMKSFASRYPWDWAADIGEVPPADLELPRRLQYKKGALPAFAAEIFAELKQRGDEAAVVAPTGKILASASDERPQSGGNETRSAVMLAMGRAGSAANLREAVLVFAGPGADQVTLEAFGTVSLGACQLFRPAAIVLAAAAEEPLRAPLAAAGVAVLVV